MLTLSVTHAAQAQAYVILANGESVSGTLVAVNSSYIRLRIPSSDKSKKFTADQIEYVRNGARDYYSRKVVTINTAHPAAVSQLVRQSTWGKINVYWHVSKMHMAGFACRNQYIEKDSSGLVLIGSSQGLIRIHNYMGVMRDQVVNEVTTLLSDNSDLTTRYLADKKRGKRAVILRYVKEYNQWFKNSLK